MPVVIKNKAEKFRFVIVGGLNTAIDFGILFGLSALGLNVIVANFISTSCAFIFSFTANRKFTFRATGETAKRQLLPFLVVTLIGLWIIQPIVILISRTLLSPLHLMDTLLILIPKLIATVFSLAWNYILYSKYVFKKNEREEAI